MEELRPDAPPDLTAIAKRVVAWHNSHPLARRIKPAQVVGVGWVALPFAQRPGVAPLGSASVSPGPVDSSNRAALSLRDRALAAVSASQTAPANAFELPVLQAQLPLPQRWWVGLKISWHAAKRRRAQAQARRKALLAAFSEDFISPLSPRQVARWALGHGMTQPGVGDWPLRTVLPDPAWGRQDARLLNLYLATAAIEAGGRRTRLLVPVGGRQPSSAVLGPRLMSAPRGIAALALVAAAGLGVLQPQLPAVPPAADWPGMAAATALKDTLEDTTARWAAMARTASTPASAAEAVVAEEPTEAEAVAMAPLRAASAEASIEAGAEAGAKMAEFAAPALLPEPDPTWSEIQPPPLPNTLPPLPPVADATAPPQAVEPPVFATPQAELSVTPATPAAPAPLMAALPPDDPPPRQAPFRPGQRLVPLLDEATKQQAKDTVAALRAARGDVPASAPAPVTPATASFAPSQVDAIAAFALTSRVLRTRAESEQMQAAVRALLAQHSAEPLLVELWPSGEDWRVVCWPFARKQDAQLARALLLTRGLRMEAIEF